jgi:hypothetical protein
MASCASVLGLGDYQSAGAVLCDKLDTCYPAGAFPDCESRVASAVKAAPTNTQAAFLQHFTDATCSATCANARGCLDDTLFCSTTACERLEDCCEFSRGAAVCQDKQCCAPRGAACDVDHPCCDGASACQMGFCGGVACRVAGDACTSNVQCCTRVCGADGTCSDKLCGGEGFECKSNDDCCSDEQNLLCDKTGHCNKPMCTLAGGFCATADDCCDGNCVDLGAGVKICSTCATRLPDGADCYQGDDCCGDACDPVYHVCAVACTATFQPCGADNECCSGSCVNAKCADKCTDGYCLQDSQCCSGTCLPGGTCAPKCPDPRCDHDVCTVGGSLSKDGTCADPRVDNDCAKAVCALDPYCCCGGWDALCVQRAFGIGGLSQPAACSTSKCVQGVVP